MQRAKILLFFALLVGLLHGWESSEFVWNLGMAQACNKGLSQDSEKYFEKDLFDPKGYEGIQEGDLVWVKSRFVKEFYDQILPNVKHPFVLVICDGDESFPSNSKLGTRIDDLIQDERVAHVFAQNCDYRGSSKKVSHFPIGLDFHTLAYKREGHRWGEPASPSEQESELKAILKELKPTHQRKKKAFVDFQHNNSMNGSFHRKEEFGEDRRSIFKRLKKNGVVDHGKRMPRADLWKTKGQYAFSISPHGNGLDCHRTWEDLVLGCIVIVKTSPLDPLYEGLPVVIVKDWSEVTEKNLSKWLDQYKDAFTNPAYRMKLTNEYWMNVIKNSYVVSGKRP